MSAFYNRACVHRQLHYFYSPQFYYQNWHRMAPVCLLQQCHKRCNEGFAYKSTFCQNKQQWEVLYNIVTKLSQLWFTSTIQARPLSVKMSFIFSIQKLIFNKNQPQCCKIIIRYFCRSVLHTSAKHAVHMKHNPTSLLNRHTCVSFLCYSSLKIRPQFIETL